jgi:hypothetical protein
MAKRSIAVLALAVLALVFLGATPALAAHTVEITFPPPTAEYYSPFDGPATITITVDPGDTDATFTARLKDPDGELVAKTTIGVLNEDADGFVTKNLSWPALSVTTLTQYTVSVSRDGSVVATESFFLHPKLVRITGATPNPFFPWIDDGYRDTTTVAFRLEAQADATALVYRARANGTCCGTRVLMQDAGSALDPGANTWEWDGRDQDGANLPKGTYFVKIKADDGAVAPATSVPKKVTIKRTYRTTATRSKPARSYHHVGPSSPLVLGGACLSYVSAGDLQILCQGAKISVFWTWRLDDDEWIVGQRFVVESTPSDCPRSIRSSAHTRHGSSFTVTENLAGSRGLCTISTAKITYSYPVAS